MVWLSQYFQRYGCLIWIALLHLDSATWLPVTISSRIFTRLIFFLFSIYRFIAQVVLACNLTYALSFMLGCNTCMCTNIKCASKSSNHVCSLYVSLLRFWIIFRILVVRTSAAPRIVVDGHVDVHVHVEVDLGLHSLRIKSVACWSLLHVNQLIDSVLDYSLAIHVQLMVERHQIFLDTVLVDAHLSASRIGSSLRVLRRSVFVLYHVLLFLMVHSSHLKPVYDFHLRSRTVRVKRSWVHVLRIVLVGPSLLVSFNTRSSLIGTTHAASI